MLGFRWLWKWRADSPASFDLSLEAQPCLHHPDLTFLLQRLRSEEDGPIPFSSSHHLSPVLALTDPHTSFCSWPCLFQKQMSGSKHRPLKVSKSPSSVQEDIEIEVAEVLYGMTKQFQCAPKQETSKIDSRDTNGGSGNEAKSRISSPNSISPAPPASLPSSVLPPSNLISNPTSLPTDGA